MENDVNGETELNQQQNPTKNPLNVNNIHYISTEKQSKWNAGDIFYLVAVCSHFSNCTQSSHVYY